MNPSEKAAEEMRRQSQGPERFAKSAIGIGAAAGAAPFASLLARAAPLLSQYIPENLAIKGLSKISPKFGQFIENVMGKGYDFNEVRDFLGEQVKESQAQSQPAKTDKNIIEQYSPELHDFINQQIQSGRSPLEAGWFAEQDKKFKSAIEKLKKDHKSPWSAILETVYGRGEGQSKKSNTPSPQPQQEEYVNHQEKTQPGQEIDPVLTQILGEINASIERRRAARG